MGILKYDWYRSSQVILSFSAFYEFFRSVINVGLEALLLLILLDIFKTKISHIQNTAPKILEIQLVLSHNLDPCYTVLPRIGCHIASVITVNV